MRVRLLSSPSQAPRQSSPSTQLTPVTKRLVSMVRRIAPVSGIDPDEVAVAILRHPERPFRPGEPGIAAAAGRPDGREHAAGLQIDLLDAILGDLKQVPAVEGRPRMRGDLDRAQHRPARRIEGVQLASGGKPDVLTVIGNAMHVVDTRKGSVLTEDFGCRAFHASTWCSLTVEERTHDLSSHGRATDEYGFSRSAVDRGVTRLS